MLASTGDGVELVRERARRAREVDGFASRRASGRRRGAKGRAGRLRASSAARPARAWSARNSCRVASSSSSSSISSRKPPSENSGVRSSWEALAMNSRRAWSSWREPLRACARTPARAGRARRRRGLRPARRSRPPRSARPRARAAAGGGRTPARRVADEQRDQQREPPARRSRWRTRSTFDSVSCSERARAGRRARLARASRPRRSAGRRASRCRWCRLRASERAQRDRVVLDVLRRDAVASRRRRRVRRRRRASSKTTTRAFARRPRVCEAVGQVRAPAG